MTTNRLVVGKPNIMDKTGFLQDVEEILETRIFTNMGPFSQKLEKEVSILLKVKHTIAVCQLAVKSSSLPTRLLLLHMR